MLCSNTHDHQYYVPLLIRKYNARTGEGLEGAVFELSSARCPPVTGSTDSNGLLELCVPLCAVYTLKETVPPEGFELSLREYHICVDANGCIFVNGIPSNTIDVPNTVISASFTMLKLDIVNDNPLADAVYTLYSNGSPVQTAISSESGELIFTKLLPGTYELSETAPPYGFQVNPDVLPIVVSDDGVVTIFGQPADGFRLYNVAMPPFIFQKREVVTLIRMQGAVFQLTQNSSLIATAVSDAQGIVNFGFLPPGEYEMIETVTPPGFLPNTNTYHVIIADDLSVTVDGIPLDSFNIENIRLTGFSFLKTSNVTLLPLPGAQFQLLQNGSQVAVAESDNMGVVTFSDLPPGTYQMIESLPPEGYLDNPGIYQVEVTSGGITIDGLPYQDFTVEDTRVTVDISVIKLDEVSQPLESAIYSLIRNDDGTTVQSNISNADGMIFFNFIEPGEYSLVEIQAPPGYMENPEKLEVIVAPDGVVTIDGLITSQVVIIDAPLPPFVEPHLLGWMRSSETYGFVPGARIPNDPPADYIYSDWSFIWAREKTLMQYFENEEVLQAALSGTYVQEALGISNESMFTETGRIVDESYVWDGGSGHQFFTGYYDGPVVGGWASWSHVPVPSELSSELYSPQTQEPRDGGYSPYHYSLRRFTAYLDVDLSQYSIDSAFLVSQFTGSDPDEFVFPLNDSIFVFVNGELAYWTSTDLIGNDNEPESRLYFYGEQGVLMTKEYVGSDPPVGARYAFTDGWYLTLGGTYRIADIAAFLTDGKNVIDVIADDYYVGGGMSRINIDFTISAL